ncbi:MAG: 2-oxoglutarate dehydrogenase E1 component [Saprospiraceae bacterium]
MSNDNSLTDTTELYGANALYIAESYESYLRDPGSVDSSWKDYFDKLGDNADNLAADFFGASWARERSKIVGAVSKEQAATQKPGKAPASAADTEALNSIRAHMLIRAYRVRGHLLAQLDPLGLTHVDNSHPELEPARYGFTEDDYDTEIILGGWLGREKATLREILSILRQAYANKIGTEFIHIQDLTKKEWLENKLESTLGRPSIDAEHKKSILGRLVEIVGFEEFLHKKFPGAKRFSAEGGENLITSMEAAVATAAAQGVKEVVVGMPHRGRLNVLTAFMGKSYTAMLSEFQGNLANPDWVNSSGDVKYHLGYSSDRDFRGNQVHLSLASNPSHLECVNPVVNGRVRAKQDQMNDTKRDQAMSLLLHGDAAFCGQGVTAEALAFSNLEGYTTGGTVHIIVNNQIGFTTMPEEGHDSPYPTDVAMQIGAPIFHVNGDDPEAVLHASNIAAEYRQTFQTDVVIDMWCYRKHGHNEGDEPRWTQPKMYAKIDAKETPRQIYAKQLIHEGVISEAEFEALKDTFYNRLDQAFTEANTYKPNKADMLEGKWSGFEQSLDDQNKPKMETGVEIDTLKSIGEKLNQEPEGVHLHKGVKRVLKLRREMIDSGEGLDWATADSLAFGSLLIEGYPVRLSGQDVIRGTFSQRHSGLWDQDSAEISFPLNALEEGQAKYEGVNSNLSEFAVLGFEYGYSTAEPKALVIWEAQFGDFANGAQVIFDQFISSGEVKWLRMSGLVVLLPHGYEGQGPEHSSARLERYLQMCAEDNMIVANCTTPANYFHILRRQLARNYRKPLIMMTPKSLLRHKRAQSSLSELAKGTSFHRILPEAFPKDIAKDKDIKRVLICSGKVYYDLLEAREDKGVKDVAIIRMEQLYPFAHNSLKEELVKYPNAEVIWCQEEPENMGAWSYVDRRIEKVLNEIDSQSSRPTYIGRPAAAATACGYMKIHQKEQSELIDLALDISASKKRTEKAA